VSSNPKTVVIGGGISGLAAAHYAGNATIIEPQARLGGILHTTHVKNCVVEQGACSWLASKTAAADLVRDLGLGDHLVGSNDEHRQTFIWKQGRMVKFPEGMQLVSPARLWPILKSPLVGKFTKARILLDWFRKPSIFPSRERTVGAFVTDHFGIEMCDYVAEPLLSGIYGGDPFELSATMVLPKLVDRERFQGSLVRGVKAEKPTGPLFETMRGGMSRLIEALTPKEWIRGEAEQIEQEGAGYRVRVNGDWIQADRVIVACESHHAANLRPEFSPLRFIRHSSASAVSLGFRSSDIRHPLNGFGLLIPKRERRNMTACTWMNTKFPHRVADGLVLLRCFFADVKKTDEELVEMARADLKETMDVEADPVFQTIARWPKSLPLYTVGHDKRVSEIDRIISELPGVKLIGSAYHGVGIPDCVKLAAAAVRSLTRR
jgi:protoporphyrinogen/coproporphyrinogen III oxidase